MLFLLKSTPKNKKKKAQRTLLSVKGAGGGQKEPAELTVLCASLKLSFFQSEFLAELVI